MGRASVVAMVVLCVACQDKSGGTGPSGSVSYANVKVTAPPNGSVTATTTHPSTTVCRIISASGPLKRDDAGVAAGEVMGDSWVELNAGAKLAVKNGTTTRETLFDGPGAVRACVNGDEEMWMGGGVFTSVIGAGETPGAEVWVVTPHAVVRYGSGAHITLNVSVPRVDVKLQSGAAWAYAIEAFTAHDAGAAKVVDGWTEIPVNANASFASRKAPSQVLGECEQAAKAAHDLGVAIVNKDASLGEAAPQHVVLRQKAHAVCAIAELLASRSLDPLERERLLPRARTANMKWRDASGNQ
jgi:hypothetical protein